MKAHIDKHQTDVEFQVGDRVYLKRQPYSQTSIATRHHTKLSTRYQVDPYQDVEKIGQVAYRLDLPKTSKN